MRLACICFDVETRDVQMVAIPGWAILASPTIDRMNADLFILSIWLYPGISVHL